MSGEGEEARNPIFKDIRRYYCEYCGICRSKKTLIATHIRANHQDEMKEKELNEEKGRENKTNTCEECGASFQKPAHLKQHMQSHAIEMYDEDFSKGEKHCHDILMGVSIGSQLKNSKMQEAVDWISTRWVTAWEASSSVPRSCLIFLKRPFMCSVDDCQSSYRRKDHLTRHMLQHQGKLFECPVEGCKSTFAFQGNMTRHVKEFHDESAPANVEHPKEHVCSEQGCGKVFKYASQLHKHEESHVKLDSVEAFCAEPGCMKYFSNEQCLKEHIRSCHQYIICDKCGKKQLKKNIVRHMRMHEAGLSSERIKCTIKGCSLTFSTTSNLKQHIKSVHLEVKPFACSIPGCDKRFTFKHVRDNHEKSGCHVFTPGDFEESDEQFRSRPRGGRKRNFPVIESLMRKRVVPPTESELEKDHRSWPLSSESQDS